MKAPIEMDIDTLMRNIVLKNQLVFGTVNAGAKDFEAAIRDIGTFRQLWPDALNAFITEHISSEEAPSQLQGASRGIKNVIAFDNS